MEYTVYHLYKKAPDIHSPSRQLLFPTQVAYCLLHKYPKTVAFVESFNFNF
jgi:hypothetical protein